MAEYLIQNTLLSVEKRAADRTLVLRRSSARAEDHELLDTYSSAITMAQDYRGWSLLMDMRDARGRNDPDFEQSVGKFRAQLREVFPRIVVLVASPVGVLQINRINRESTEGTSLVTTSEKQALDWCREAQGL